MSISMRLRVVGCVAVAAVLQGCSMHPLPEDVTRKNTYDIVENIRCEAAQGLRGVPRDHPILKNTFIGYDFDFTIEENNNAGTKDTPGSLTLTQQYNKADSLVVNATPFAQRTRTNARSFRVIESLLELSNADCASMATRPNRAYPITGAIGMQEVVRTYIGIEKLTNFAGVQSYMGSPTQSTAGASSNTPISVVFSDVLIFTTTIGGGLKPELKLSAGVIGELTLTNATIGLDATRKDIHKVTVALARDPAKPVELPHGRSNRVQRADRFYTSNVVNDGQNTIYNRAISRTVDTIARKELTAETLVLLELERRRDQAEEAALATRLINILQAPP